MLGKRKNVNNATSHVDQYRKQLGRQESKIVKKRQKEIKETDAKKETVSKFKTFLVFLAITLMLSFLGYIIYQLYFTSH